MFIVQSVSSWDLTQFILIMQNSNKWLSRAKWLSTLGSSQPTLASSIPKAAIDYTHNRNLVLLSMKAERIWLSWSKRYKAELTQTLHKNCAAYCSGFCD